MLPERFRRYLPEPHTLREHRMLRWIGPALHHPRLWHVNRRGIALGIAIGVFFGLLIPVLQIVVAAGAAILPLFRTENGLEDKGPAGAFDPVTAADRGAEAAIRQAVAGRFPDHGVIGEEYGEDRPDAEFVWVLDPIDGTRAFIAGLPVWTTLIALRHRGRPGGQHHLRGGRAGDSGV
jgi:hypothetical protein